MVISTSVYIQDYSFIISYTIIIFYVITVTVLSFNSANPETPAHLCCTQPAHATACTHIARPLGSMTESGASITADRRTLFTAQLPEPLLNEPATAQRYDRCVSIGHVSPDRKAWGGSRKARSQLRHDRKHSLAISLYPSNCKSVGVSAIFKSMENDRIQPRSAIDGTPDATLCMTKSAFHGLKFIRGDSEITIHKPPGIPGPANG